MIEIIVMENYKKIFIIQEMFAGRETYIKLTKEVKEMEDYML